MEQPSENIELVQPHLVKLPVSEQLIIEEPSEN
jgi:hypothetical protein